MGVILGRALLYDVSTMNRPAQHTGAVSLREAADADLADRSRAGDFPAFEELVRRYRNDVFRLAYHYVRNREEAWDISQDVFVKVFGGLSGFRGEANIKTWMLRITANQCKDHLKKRRLATVPLEDVARDAETPSRTLDPSQALEAQEIGRAIEAALNALPHKHRTALILREYEGMSYEEMAQVMACNIGTVMSRLFHARKKMQRALIDMGIVEDSAHA